MEELYIMDKRRREFRKGRPNNFICAKANKPSWGRLKYCVEPYFNQITIPIHVDGLIYKKCS